VAALKTLPLSIAGHLVVDADRVAAMLQRLRGELAYLSARAADDRAAVRGDEERMSGLKYRFVTALETLASQPDTTD
jgi:hypothetical protein